MFWSRVFSLCATMSGSEQTGMDNEERHEEPGLTQLLQVLLSDA